MDPWLLRWTSDRVKLKGRLSKIGQAYRCISDVCHSLSSFNNILFYNMFTIFYTLSMLSMPLHRALTKEKCLMPDLPGTRPAKGFQHVLFKYVQIIMFKSFNAQVILSHVKGCSRLWWLRESPQQKMYTNVASRGLFWGSHGHFIFASDSINVSSMYSMNFQWIFNVQ